MRTAQVVALTIVALGCKGKTTVPIAEPRARDQQGRSEEIAYVDVRPESIVKRFPSEPDPATNAEDPVSCRKAAGEWSDSYQLGVLILREPQEGARRAGKMCWSARQLTNDGADAVNHPGEGRDLCAGFPLVTGPGPRPSPG